MANIANIQRYQRLKGFMVAHRVTLAALAEKLGFGAESSVRYHLASEVCPTELHAKLLELGFPLELLPRPEDKQRGPAPRQPDWDSLRQAAGGQPPIIP